MEENIAKFKKNYKYLGGKLRKRNSKWKVFADEFIESGNASEAYVKAGYNSKSESSIRKNASRLMTNEDIKAYIDARSKYIAVKNEAHKIATAEEVMEFYTRVLRKEEKEQVVIATAKSVEIVEKEPSLKDRMSAAREIAKRYPNISPMEQARLRRLLADARTSEAKATIAERLGSEGDDKLDELMDKLIKESDKK